jgi:hypothetical protein
MGTAPEKFAMPHLTFGIVVDRIYDRLKCHVAARRGRVRERLFGRTAKPTRLGKRGEQSRFFSFGRGIEPGGILLGHAL